MKSKIIFFLFGFMLLFIGCKNITEGVVIDKYYTPKHDSVIFFPIYMNRAFTMIPKIIHVEESWTIIISSTAGKKEKHRRIKVTQEVFEGTDIGDRFSIKEATL